MGGSRNYTVARDRSQGILGFFGLVALCGALGYGAWIVLTRPRARQGAPRSLSTVHTGPDSVGFVSVAGEGIELELIAPDGRRTSTSGSIAGEQRIARSEPTVDCQGFVTPGAKEAPCTVSINLTVPATGDYTVIARGSERRTAVLNVGWATVSQARRGAFDVRVQVGTTGVSSFKIIVSRDGVSQRSEPRVGVP